MKTSTTSVQTTIISSDDLARTYEVKKVLLDDKGDPVEGKEAVLIGMYPTTTAEEPYKTDLSTNHLVCKMEELGLRSVRILNLFSQVRESEKLSARGLEVDQENLAHIESVMKEPEFQESPFIVAWGNSMASSRAANLTKARVAKLFRDHNPQGKPLQLSAPSLALDSEECVHVLYLGIRHKRETWSLCEYRFPQKEIPVEKPAKRGRKKALKTGETGTGKEGSAENNVPETGKETLKEGRIESDITGNGGEER